MSSTQQPQTVEQLKSAQNFALAIPAGIAAALVGAVVWALVVVQTNTKLGIIAVAIGYGVGWAIKKTGHGIEPKFGYLGAACAAFGWALGTLLTDISLLAHVQNISFQQAALGLDANGLVNLVSATADPMDALFLGIAVYEGYKFSFKYRLKKQAA